MATRGKEARCLSGAHARPPPHVLDLQAPMSRQVDERPYTHKLPPVTPLITPSVSPPRSRAPFRPSGHPPEHPSPSKRPRLVRTPSSPPSSAASASNAVALTVAEIEASRRAAVTRLSNAWSQLAKRYIRNLDEDDIIDLRSIDIVEDRGNIRALEPDAHVSSVWAGELPSADTSSDAGGAQTEVEDELDELDAFAGGGEEGGDHLPIVKSFVGVPPMRPGDPMDDHDLREFLEEEKTNQVKAGRLDDEYSDSQADNEQPVRTQHEDVEESAEEDSSSEDLPLSTVTQKPKAKKQPRARPRKSTRPPPARLSSRPLPPADESEDELGIWVNDESSAIYRVVRDDELIDDEEEASSSSPASNAAILPVLDDDVIEISDSDSPSPSPRRNRMERIPQPSSPSPAPRTLFQHKQSVPTSELQPVAVAPPQLQTPPQSFTSEFSFSPDPPSPPIDVPARPKPKPRPAYKGAKSQTRSQPLAFISEPLLEAAGPSVNSTFVAPATQTKSTIPIKVSPRLNKSTKRPTPQVIITGRARSAAPARTPLSEMVKPAQDEPNIDQREQPKVKGKGKAKTSVDSSQYHRRPKNAARDMPSKVDRKGKGRAVESPVESAASLGAITSPPSGSSSGSSPFSLRRTAITVSPPLKPSIGRKRKRRSSLPEIPANETVESDLSKRPPESRGRRQSQEVAPSSPTSSSHSHEFGRSVSPKPLKTFAGTYFHCRAHCLCLYSSLFSKAIEDGVRRVQFVLVLALEPNLLLCPLNAIRSLRAMCRIIYPIHLSIRLRMVLLTGDKRPRIPHYPIRKLNTSWLKSCSTYRT